MANKKPDGDRKPKPGKAYERKVSKAVKRLYPNKLVEEDVKRPGVISGGTRQIDTLLHHEEGLIDFEAKDYKRNVGIDTIAKYAFKVKDEQVPNGIMVSNSAYAPTAVNTAKYFNIKLTHLVDTSDKQNRIKVAQKALIEDKVVRSLRMGIHDRGFESISVPRDLTAVVLENEAGQQMTAYNVFQDMWNEGVCPDEDGPHVGTLYNQHVVMTDGRVVPVSEFYFDYIVETIYRKGDWSLLEAAGFFNVTDNSFTTNGNVTSAVLSTDEMNKWPQISKEEASLPGFGIKMEVKSMLPDDPPSTYAATE